MGGLKPQRVSDTACIHPHLASSPVKGEEMGLWRSAASSNRIMQQPHPSPPYSALENFVHNAPGFSPATARSGLRPLIGSSTVIGVKEGLDLPGAHPLLYNRTSPKGFV